MAHDRKGVIIYKTTVVCSAVASGLLAIGLLLLVSRLDISDWAKLLIFLAIGITLLALSKIFSKEIERAKERILKNQS